GAHLCEWAPAGQSAPVLFLSPRSAFTAGTAIRGGVPVCFPCFAAHPSDARKPAHGFARTRMWQVDELTRDDARDVRVALRLASDAETRAYWNAAFTLSLTLSLGASLTMTAEVENTGRDEIVYELALHTYLAVGDVEAIRIHGLERTRFVDKVDGMRDTAAGSGPLTLDRSADSAAPTGQPCVMVMFGASGDLTRRLLMPALYNLACDGLLPKRFALVGVAMDELTTEQFRAKMSTDIRQFSTRKQFDDEVWSDFVRH